MMTQGEILAVAEYQGQLTRAECDRLAERLEEFAGRGIFPRPRGERNTLLEEEEREMRK